MSRGRGVRRGGALNNREGSGVCRSLREARLVIATDLDGTFLGGSDDDRSQLYGWLRSHSSTVGLIFVTGRAFESVAPLLEDPTIPFPDLVIADVGASWGRAFRLEPMVDIESRLRANWPGREAVLRVFAGLGLEEKVVPQRGRVSFLVTDASLVELSRARAASHNLNVVYSGDRYLDVLPAGVDKGRALLAVIDHLRIAPQNVLACGDTLNDLSLFGIGLNAVAVGASEPALLEATRGRPKVLHARLPGAAGITEAISHFLRTFAWRCSLMNDASLIIVYHREPWEELVVAGKSQWRDHRSLNGIIPTLRGAFGQNERGLWGGVEEMQDSSHPDFERDVSITREGTNLRCT